jgi:uncharacterized membrane protein YqjE
MKPNALFSALDRAIPAARVILPALAHRGELASLEAGEARDHLAGSLALTLGAAILTLLGGFAATFAFAALVWAREDRGVLLALVALIYFLAAAGLAWVTTRRLGRWQPLPETRRQLLADQACLRDLLPSRPDSEQPSP